MNSSVSTNNNLVKIYKLRANYQCKRLVQIELPSRQSSTFWVEFQPTWSISPSGVGDIYQSDLYQGYCDYIGINCLSNPSSIQEKYIQRRNKYSQIEQYRHGSQLAAKEWGTTRLSLKTKTFIDRICSKINAINKLINMKKISKSEKKPSA
ncbi:MAG: hypothetical protein QNJ54_31345 [Prochloraceae cyanobacterium]|nr:hypothetical protein [Prochloraceae cyanobacterium]